MQHIGLQLEDERGNVIKDSPINFVDITALLLSLENGKDRYPWLYSIDPYGNTVFNVHQVPYLINELKQLLIEAPNEDIKQSVKNIIAFLNLAKQHEYIRFTGD